MKDPQTLIPTTSEVSTESKATPTWWRSMEELANSEQFQQHMKQEFPEDAGLWQEDISRRDFLKLMGAGFSLAFFTGCRSPIEKIIPFNENPEDVIPGKPLYYASAVCIGGYAKGVLVENHMGRPTKIEGNPDHPASLGATDSIMQASVLSLYDPDRSQVFLHDQQFSTWSFFASRFKEAVNALPQGEGFRILTETVTSPTLAEQLKALSKKYPAMRWHTYDPLSKDNAREGSRLAFGDVIESQYKVSSAKILLSIDSDFLFAGPASLRYAREFSQGRRVEEGGSNTMSRLYAVEVAPSVTGTLADHRLPLRPSEIEEFVRALAQRLGVTGVTSGKNPVSDRWFNGLVSDLQANRGESLIVAGDEQPAWVHALVHTMNQILGNVGRTVVYTAPVTASTENNVQSLQALAADMNAGKVHVLAILGGNPAYTAPADINFAAALQKVPFRTHLSLYQDETSEICNWHLPETHSLESWGDARAYDGTASIIQPLIEPLFGGKTPYEVLSVLLDDTPRLAFEIVRDTWRTQIGGLNFDAGWQTALHDGFVKGTAFPTKTETIHRSIPTPSPTQASELEVSFRPDPFIRGGEYANNAWLQELPKPITTITWDNAAYMSPATATKLGLANEDVVTLSLNGRQVEAPVWVLPGHAAGAVTLPLGFGRTKSGHVGTHKGFDAYQLRTTVTPDMAFGLQIKNTGKHYKIACTQEHHNMENRNLVRLASYEEFKKHPEFAKESQNEEDPAPKDSLFKPAPELSETYQWGMSIDLNTCIGCNACMLACQSENNIPTVGKEQVARGREMHWIRIDRYYWGDLENPEFATQPVPCMHCENAPCEPVCPVAATVHSDEGLNQMVYNRCVGTRYCSNNCPYKVRRFNFLHYATITAPTLKMLQNPDVTVRARGVMEKCTYCVQRIEYARIESNKQNRSIRDGEIVTACSGACPTQSIVFGNILDKDSAVAKEKASPRNYGILTDLGTRPRTTYLAKVRNPNPTI